MLDARFDAQVPRTAGRPVASGRLASSHRCCCRRRCRANRCPDR
ncbi:hypothetical protein [Streptomyces sp. NPDC088135]